MGRILFIDDNLPGNSAALTCAVSLAGRMGSHLLKARTAKPKDVKKEKVTAGNINSQALIQPVAGLPEANRAGPGEIDISGWSLQEAADLINKGDITLIVKCVAEYRAPGSLDPGTLLNHIHCPLLLIPANWSFKDPERIVYLADLRYCRTDIVRYLAALAAACRADLSVAHLTKEDLVHIDESYAHCLFEEQVRRQVKYHRLSFNYTRERDLIKAVDVLTNGMRHDLLALTRNRYHFNKLVGRELDKLPSHIQIPLLIFPG
ncbi:hypothetical protein [Mucilaginibacter sp. UR6-11]|uniref:hypothetical protein n=1 Tax=Mucilaginibacter sp. UR6-11 TaxID=1435644 RepID=UPI001E58F646|nr:hypothetical protein [Mucilaginibacter sp. UR6-11]MCC8425497.1 hypothetical protein [Mucilaginibacter sp. UR6-11]